MTEPTAPSINTTLLASLKGRFKQHPAVVDAMRRFPPGKLVIGELADGEAHKFLRTINTGHPGNIAHE